MDEPGNDDIWLALTSLSRTPGTVANLHGRVSRCGYRDARLG